MKKLEKLVGVIAISFVGVASAIWPLRQPGRATALADASCRAYPPSGAVAGG